MQTMDIHSYLANIKKEELRNDEFLHLTANENQMSKTALSWLDATISQRYYFGGGNRDIVDFEPFTALAFNGVEALVNKAKDAAKEMLFASDVNLNVLSGVHAMMCAILSTTNPADTVMSVKIADGGHFATQPIIERVGRTHIFASYDLETQTFDVKKIAEAVKAHNVKALYLDVSYYLNPHNLSEIRRAIGEDVIIIYDASHTMGLIMGQEFQAPLKEGANVMCANTHKTLPGPHKGMIAFRDQNLADKANAIIDGCLYSTPHMTHLIALSITILELKEFGKEYAQQIIANSNALAKAFANLGYSVRKANNGNYSQNHQTHVYIDTKGDRLPLYERLINNNISTNFDSKPFGNKLFIRLGTAEVTRRGMKETEMQQIAAFIDSAFKGEDVRLQVIEFNKKFSKIYFSFDK
jgi:glycine hydroxymethyltransferase